MKKLTFFIQIILILFFVSIVKAAECSVAGQCYCRFYPDGQAGAVGGNVTISKSCAIYGDVDGVVAGNLTILPNTTITLHKTLVFSPGYKIDIQEIGTGEDKQRGIVYINTGGMMKQGQICVKDNDNDGYAETKTLDKDPFGVALVNPITQIDQIFSEGSCPATYRLRANMNDLTVVDNDPNTNDVTKLSTSDREMLRLGFELNGITDVEAAVGDIQIINKNLLVCTESGCPGTTFNPLTGNLYVASNVGIGTTSPTSKLEINGDITFSNYGSSGNRGIRGTMADNDGWLIRGASTVSNGGYLEIATGDDGQAAGAEQILVRQYGPGMPWSGTLVRTAALLDSNGNSSFPGTVTAPTFSGNLSGTFNGYSLVSQERNNEANKIVRTQANGYLFTGYINSSNGNENNNANADRVWGTNGGDDFLRTYRTSALSVNYANSVNCGNSLCWNSWNYNNYYQTNGDIYMGWAGNWLSAILSQKATHRGEGTNFIDYSYGLYDAYRGGWRTSNDLQVAYAYSSGQATNATNVNGGTGYFTGHITINNASPTIYMQDTDNRSAMIHTNSNLFYVLRGSGTNSASWATYNGVWPMQINLENNNANFGGAVTATSDVRLKTNIKPLPENILEKVKQLRGVYFNWKVEADMGKNTQIGVIAQEVENIFPELVSVGADGYKTFAYDRLGVILIEAVKEQQVEIDSLKQQVTDLNQRLIELENKLK